MNKTEVINNGWKFFRGDDPMGYYKGLDDTQWQDVTLPHDWSVAENFDIGFSSGTGYLSGGCGWYRKHFTLLDDIDDKCVYITFDGVYCNSRVWCNSNYLGKRPYGYSSFTYDISEFVVPGENVISVKVSRKHLADSRWFTGSGIYRDVTLSVKEINHFAPEGGIFVHCDNISAEHADVTVDWTLCGGDAETQFAIKLADQTVATAKGNGADGSVTLSIENPSLWSDETPVLYTLCGTVLKDEHICDETEIPFGIRSIRFDVNKGFFLNGESKKLKGVCVHHDAGALGAAVPACVWERRLEKLKACGCNAVRTSHNPPDPHLLDLCDKMGFLVMDEAFDEWEGFKNKWWQGHNVYPPKHFGYADDFREWHEIDLSAMILRDRNHPSVIMWSIGNEIDYPNDPYVHESFRTVMGNNDHNKPEAERKYDKNKPDAKRLTSIATELNAIIKKHDTTRPTTVALAFPEMSNLIGLCDTVDITGYNYKENLYEKDHADFPYRMIYGSENGKHPEAWNSVLDNDYICGQFLWTGIDYLGEAHGWPIRASGAGILTLNADEKPAYYHRCAMWSDRCTAKLSTISENGKTDRFSWNYEPGEQVTVWCYTNATDVELTLNGKSLGKQTVDAKKYAVKWNVPFEAGILRVTCTDRDGNQITDTLRTAGKAEKIRVKAYEPKHSNRDMLQLDITVHDPNGELAVNDNVRIEVIPDDNGELMGLENGDLKDLTPYYANYRTIKNGKLLAFIRPKDPDKKITVTIKTDSGICKIAEY